MAIFSDMNGFPESGFPVLANDLDMICLNTLYWNPLKISGFTIDVNGTVRFGNVTCGSVTATGIAAGGAISGATTIAANNTVTLSHATAPLTISGANAVLLMTGWNAGIGSLLQRIPKGWFKNLDVQNVPTVNGEEVALISDIQRTKVQVADGTYTIGIGGTQNGTITIANGVITAIQEAIA